MITIERNPTHIEQVHIEQAGETRLDGVIPKKGQKNDGLGGFAKLLAGLISKKTKVQPEGMIPQEVAAENITGSETVGKAKQQLKLPWDKNEKAAVLSKGEKSKQLKEKPEKPEGMGFDIDALGFNQNAQEALKLALAEAKQAALDKEKGLNAELDAKLASVKSDSSGQKKDSVERNLPFKNKEAGETPPEAEVQKAALQFKKDEKALQQEDRSGGNRTESKKQRRDRVALEVHDLRTHTGTEAEIITRQGLKGVEEIRNNPVHEITLDIRPSGEWNEGTFRAEAKALPGGETFSQLLARELNGQLSTDIVRQAVIVLRDGGEGTIKLSLRPESLGKVKIHLEMAENKVLGHIIVESEEALRAFKQEIQTLEQAFRDSGYEASLNAALDYRNDGQRWKEDQTMPFFSERLAASYDESGTVEIFGGYDSAYSAVNMLV